MIDAAGARGVTSRWRYRAADAAGAGTTGEIDAATEREAVDALRRRALWVTSIEPVGAPRAMVTSTATGSLSPTGNVAAPIAWRTRLARAVGSGTIELAVLVRAIATLLDAGVPLERALAYAADTNHDTTGVGAASNPVSAGTDEWRRAFASVRDAVRRGESFSGAVAREPAFPAVFAPTLAAGEASGTLGAVLTRLADHLDRSAALQARLRSALVYPALLGVASIVALVVIMAVVVPRFASLVTDSGGSLPLSTRSLIAVSDAITRWWWIGTAIVLVVFVAARSWLSTPANRLRLHAARLGWPVVGSLERTRAAAGYTGVLAIALSSGVSLLQGMNLARRVVRNDAVAARLAEAESRVRDGSGLASALSGTLPPLAIRLLDAGEAGGELAAMAQRASDAADAELQRVAGGAVAMVEPALILAFGGLVGFVALALLQAIYGLNARTM